VQTSSIENGYAIAIVTLTAFLIESVCGRARFIRQINQRMSAEATIRLLGDAELASDVKEVFVVRDAAAHGHLWVAKVAWKDDQLVFVSQPAKLPQYGDTKFRGSSI
jgi:hypothetical protein